MYSHLGKKVNVKSGNGDNIILALEQRGFCAALVNSRAKCAQSQDISDFRPLLRKAAVSWVDYVSENLERDAIPLAEELGFSKLLVTNLMKNPRAGYEDLNDEMGLLLPAIHVEGFEVKLDPLLILMRKNVLFTLHTSGTKRFFRVRRYAETLLKKLPTAMAQNDRMTMLLIRILDENNARNFDYLQVIEEHGDELSQKLSDTKVSRESLGKSIYEMKHALIVYLSGLWATADALGSLRYGDADLITDNPKIINRLTGLVGEVHAQIGLAEHLSDVLASGLEVLQSIYNNQLQLLNNRLALLVAYLTIIGTALLVPNTIATVMSNSMFGFSAADEQWYIALIILSTVFATALSWWVVKQMGLLPKSPDSDGK